MEPATENRTGPITKPVMKSGSARRKNAMTGAVQAGITAAMADLAQTFTKSGTVQAGAAGSTPLHDWWARVSIVEGKMVAYACFPLCAVMCLSGRGGRGGGVHPSLSCSALRMSPPPPTNSAQWSSVASAPRESGGYVTRASIGVPCHMRTGGMPIRNAVAHARRGISLPLMCGPGRRDKCKLPVCNMRLCVGEHEVKCLSREPWCQVLSCSSGGAARFAWVRWHPVHRCVVWVADIVGVPRPFLALAERKQKTRSGYSIKIGNVAAAEEKNNIILVEEIEKHKCLYDPSVKGCSQKHTTDKAWHAVSTECKASDKWWVVCTIGYLRPPGHVVMKYQLLDTIQRQYPQLVPQPYEPTDTAFDFFTVKECKDKWKNIRTVFRRYLSTKPPSGSAAPIRKYYYLNDVLEIDKKNQWAICYRHHTKLKTRAAQMLLVRESLMLMSRYVRTKQEESHPQTTSGCSSQPTVNQLRRKRISTKRKTVSDELDSCMTEYFRSKIHKDGSDSSRADGQLLLSLQGDPQMKFHGRFLSVWAYPFADRPGGALETSLVSNWLLRAAEDSLPSVKSDSRR
ncbi:hypothetical protein PR048_023080 [Dryococelus australis]|uniref:MADF domain-containing protein n=1 Tax=Dryococelus australis TaxID=614101 RepID=A0ABQ9GT29_9NEOP|nr:hypothetical protein PR048_023080 [Dryococelus australis]